LELELNMYLVVLPHQWGANSQEKSGLKNNNAWWSLKNLTFNFLRYLYLSSNSLVSVYLIHKIA